MNVNLHLSPDRQAALERRAADVGLDLSNYILRVVEEDLDVQSDSEYADLPYDKWKIQFDAWIASHQHRNSHVDDSRESIYD